MQHWEPETVPRGRSRKARGSSPSSFIGSIHFAAGAAVLAWGASASAEAPARLSGVSSAVASNVVASSVGPGTGASAPAAEAPIELDTALSGETRAARAERGRLFQGLILLSAADGVGAGGQLHSGWLGVRATLAYQPLMFLVDRDPADKKFGSYQFSSSIQLNADALLMSPDSEKGASLGYRYNDLLGHGASVAYQSMFDMWGERFSLSFPVTYYPAASNRVRDRFGIESNYHINFPFGAGLQFGVGAAWVL